MTVEEKVSKLTENGKELFRKSIYDILSVAIILTVIVTSLDIFGIKEVSWSSVPSLIVEWVPFLLAAILLNSNLYEKGKYVAKNTKTYIAAITTYSVKASNLTGEKLKFFPKFCNEKNNEVKLDLQKKILQSIGFTIDDYNEVCKLTNEELREKYDEETVNVILKAKNVHITGYKLNLILGNYDTSDETDLGPTEDELSKKYKVKNTLFNICSTVLLTLIGIKDVFSWGWSGLLIVLFKTGYTFARGYTSYFKGYNDVAVKLTNQIIRKTDIFKEYDYWFDVNKPSLSNNIEK